ncbi:MAG: T9SS type A sorting domain-containing protein [Taibaiella sp.]|nr:T9SS type A sorting domain-containing protein [Taibaiella sp.]
MKKLLLLPLAVLFFIAATAQNKTYRFHFNNRLSENVYQGNALAPVCQGTYSFETVAGVYKRVYNFDKGCGLVFSDSATNLLSSGSYTIELYFRLDTITGYKKLVDFDSLGTDAGFYNQNGKLVMYNQLTNTDSTIGAGKFEYAAITRDGSTKDMYIYHNNKVIGTLNDNTDQYIYGAEKLLIFFKDDNGTSGEQSSGSVAMIHISNYVMDSTTIKNNYNGLGTTLGIEQAAGAEQMVRVWPNPATDIVDISGIAAGSYTLHHITGRVMVNGEIKAGKATIGLHSYPAGIYVLQVFNSDGQATAYKLLKQ